MEMANDLQACEWQESIKAAPHYLFQLECIDFSDRGVGETEMTIFPRMDVMPRVSKSHLQIPGGKYCLSSPPITIKKKPFI